jgi:dTDP-4-dehydrorhamnose reductase
VVIVNAAAYTAVDRAESELELADSVNVAGPRNIAVAARDCDARLIHVSTDFVFDGEAGAPYAPEAATNPLSVYGRTKRDGEVAVLREMPDAAMVVRTAWLYSKTGGNFVKTMLRLMAERDELNVVADQRGTPTWANSLAEAVWQIAACPGSGGVCHWTDGGEATWHEFAVAIQDEAVTLGLVDKKIPINAITTAEYPTPARRPAYTVLDCSSAHAAVGFKPPHWQVNLREMLKGLTT